MILNSELKDFDKLLLEIKVCVCVCAASWSMAIQQENVAVFWKCVHVRGCSINTHCSAISLVSPSSSLSSTAASFPQNLCEEQTDITSAEQKHTKRRYKKINK